MTKSQNTKNEQQKDLCITSEQLTDGYHYAIVFDKERIIEKKKDLPIPYCEGFCCHNYQYLAPVPSYDEWQALKASYEMSNDANLKQATWMVDMEKENAQLKELLKECKRQFEKVELYRYDVADTDQEDWFKISTEQASIANKMIAKIDEVLK